MLPLVVPTRRRLPGTTKSSSFANVGVGLLKLLLLRLVRTSLLLVRPSVVVARVGGVAVIVAGVAIVVFVVDVADVVAVAVVGVVVVMVGAGEVVCWLCDSTVMV